MAPFTGTGLVIPHRRPPARPAGGELCDWKKEHNRSREQDCLSRLYSAGAPGARGPGAGRIRIRYTAQASTGRTGAAASMFRPL